MSIFRDFFVKKNQSLLESLEVLVVLVLVEVVVVPVMLELVRQQVARRQPEGRTTITFTLQALLHPQEISQFLVLL